MMRRKNGTNENSKEVSYEDKERGEGRIKEARGQRRMVFQRDGDGREWYFKIGREKRLLRNERRKIEGGEGKGSHDTKKGKLSYRRTRMRSRDRTQGGNRLEIAIMPHSSYLKYDS